MCMRSNKSHCPDHCLAWRNSKPNRSVKDLERFGCVKFALTVMEKLRWNNRVEMEEQI